MPGFDDRPPAMPGADLPYVLDTRTSARTRHPFVTEHAVPGDSGATGFRVTVALPSSYERAKRRRYPLVLLPVADDLFGSAVEMARTLGASKEARECIVVAHDDPSLAPGDVERQARRLEQIATWCREHFRVQASEVALFGSGRALACVEYLFRTGSEEFDRWIAALPAGADPARWSAPKPVVGHHAAPRVACAIPTLPATTWPAGVAGQVLGEATTEGVAIPAFVHGLRTFWSTGRPYGGDVMPLSKPLVAKVLAKARPLIRRLRGGSPLQRPAGGGVSNRHILRSRILARDFEIFVTLPDAGARPGPYPAVMALDANTTCSVVSETALRMARTGEIEDVITIAVGVPRSEGEIGFGLRRFEEMSPPGDATVFDDALGRFFVGIFALFGADVRDHFGLAPLFHRFLCEELLRPLLATLPIDPARVSLLGHSAAGTFVGYAMAQPDSPFSNFAALSPGVAIGKNWMLKPDGGLRARPGSRSVFVSLGGEERANPFNGLAGIPLADRYAQALRAASGAPVEFHELAGESHTSVFPRAVPLVLSRRFGIRN